jgi:hypothetical protein
MPATYTARRVRTSASGKRATNLSLKTRDQPELEQRCA